MGTRGPIRLFGLDFEMRIAKAGTHCRFIGGIDSRLASVPCGCDAIFPRCLVSIGIVSFLQVILPHIVMGETLHPNVRASSFRRESTLGCTRISVGTFPRPGSLKPVTLYHSVLIPVTTHRLS